MSLRGSISRMLIVAVLATVLVPLSWTRPAEAARTSAVIVLDADGPSVTEELLRADARVTWQNRSGEVLTVTGANGILDSGPIPDGGSYSAALTVPGTYVWDSAVGGGEVTAIARLPSGNALPLLANLEHTPFPPRTEGDLVMHPSLAIETSVTRAVVRFRSDATVWQARSAMIRANVDLLGSLPRLGLVLVGVPPQDDHRQIDRAISSLRGQEGVEAVVPDLEPVSTRLPAPSDLSPDDYGWVPPQVAPVGDGGNWGLELSRLPAVWNLDDAWQLRGDAAGRSVVIDDGFEAHQSLPRMTVERWCVPGLLSDSCTSTTPRDHGNHVAGILAAGHAADASRAETTVGTVGVDPHSQLHAVSRFGLSGLWPVLDELLARLESGSIPDVRVVSASLALSIDPGAWMDAFADQTCGTDAAGQPRSCHPQFEPERRALAEDYGVMMRRAIESFVDRLEAPPVFVFGAGNDSAFFCDPLTSSCAAPVPVPAELVSLGSIADRDWDPNRGPSPILVVEAIGDIPEPGFDVAPDVPAPGTHRAFYSNPGGHVSAPGYALSTASSEGGCGAGADGYCDKQGTSMATPFVSGVVGLVRTWAPQLAAGQVAQHLRTWAVDDTTDGAAPRVDAFLTLTSLPGVAHHLVDVNDPSDDGNRRVIRSGDSEVLDTTLGETAGRFSAPDGQVDMRDLRRWRDAWLQRCALDPERGCPDRVLLDGPEDHPKRDLNQDGCVSDRVPEGGQPCPSELTWPRFDLVGSGSVSVVDRATVGIRSDGQPASDPSEASELSDLALLSILWDEGSPGAEGVTAGQLRRLAVSGDLEVHLDGLERSGADEVLLEVLTEAEDELFTSRTVAIEDGPALITVPAGEPWRIAALAVGEDGIVTTTTEPISVIAGEDRQVDLCGGLGLQLGADQLRPGNATTTVTTTVTASVRTCLDDTPPTEVGFSLEPTRADGATLSASTATTDADGRATVTLSSGSATGDYRIRAEAAVPVDDVFTEDRVATAMLRVADRYRIETLARTGGASVYRDLLVGETVEGPSINAAGEVAFGARRTDQSGDRVIVLGDDVDPDRPELSQDVFSGVLNVPELAGQPQLADDGTLVAALSTYDPSDGIRSGVYRIDAGDAAPERLVGGHLPLSGTPDEELWRVERPAVNAAGDVVFGAWERDPEQLRMGAVVDGEVTIGEPTPRARPRLADDGTAVSSTAVPTGEVDDRGFPLFEELITVGDAAHTDRGVLAGTAGDGWTGVARPTIAANGQAVAFAGERGDDGAVYIALRSGDSPLAWLPPVAVAGSGVDDELDAGDGTRRTFAEVPGPGNRPGLVHLPGGQEGPVGDRVLVSFRATPDASGEGFTAEPGLWMMALDVVDGDDGPVLELAWTEPVLQVGDGLGTATITDLVTSDALATPIDGGRDDHHLAVVAATTEGDRVLRITSLRADAPFVLPASLAAPVGAASSVVTSGDAGSIVLAADTGGGDTSGPAADAEVTDARVVPAITVHDDTPPRGQPVTVVNRSRDTTGRPVDGVLRELGPDPLDRVIEPDQSRELVPMERGWTDVRLAAPVAPDAEDLRVPLDVQQGPYQPPEVDLNGPWELSPGAGVVLTASLDDPDGFASVWQGRWDLTGDGEYDDRTGSRVTLDGDEVRDLVCGGACEPNQPYPVSFRLVDTEGAELLATSTITVDEDRGFTFDAQPRLLQINPGSHGTVQAIVRSEGGFAGRVDLSVAGLPEGWSAWETSVTGEGTRDLRIAVPSEGATEGEQFDLEVVAVSGDIEYRVPITVTTVFGLIRQCEGQLSGRITDAASGAPIGGVDVAFPALGVSRTQTTDADGRYELTATLREGFQAWSIAGRVISPDYYDASGMATLVCGESRTFDLVLDARQTGSLELRTVVGLPNPLAGQEPLATDEPLSEVQVRVSPRNQEAAEWLTDADGRLLLEGLAMNELDEALRVGVTVIDDRYWPTSRVGFIQPDGELDLGDLPVLERCTGTLGGGYVVDQHLQPIEGAQVREGLTVRTTDAAGRFDLGVEVDLGLYNRSRTTSLVASSPPEWEVGDSSSGPAVVPTCGATSTDVTLQLQREDPPQDLFATIEGVATDEETAAPLADVRVDLERLDGWTWRRIDRMQTDADGTYRFEDVLVGTDAQEDPQRRVRVIAAPEGYWPTEEETLLRPDDDVTLDMAFLRERVGEVTGTVTDRATDAPIPDAWVRLSAANQQTGRITTTDADGRFGFADVVLGDRNADRAYGITARKEDPDRRSRALYWTDGVDVLVTATEPTEQDLDLLPVCDAPMISGIVVDADDLSPLEGVRVTAGDRNALTDEDGRYTIEDVRIGTDNEPLRLDMRATKDGFFPAESTVTVFCGARLEVDFGQPVAGFGAIVGSVTDRDGAPLSDVFVGSSYGSSTTTDTDGAYRLERAPLTPEGEPREWIVTAIGAGDEVAETVTVSAGTDTPRDFVLGRDNEVPSATDLAVRTDQDQPVQIAFTGSDPDSDVLSFEVVDAPGHGQLLGSPPQLTYQPDPGFHGEDTVTYVADDGRDTSPPATVTITVAERPNTPPELELPERLVVTAGTQGEAGVRSLDEDGDAVTLAASGLPDGANFLDHDDGIGQVRYAPPVDAPAAETEVTVTADDGTDTTSATLLLVVVAADPGPPIAAADEVVQVLVGEEVVLDGSRSRAADGGDLAFSWSFRGETYDDAVVSLPTRTPLIAPATLTVTDGRGVADSVTVDVEVVNVPPLLEVIERRVDGIVTDHDPLLAPPDEAVGLLVGLTDPALDAVHEASIDWGDGTVTRPELLDGPALASAGTDAVASAPEEGPLRRHLEVEHAYGAPGAYTVLIEACDDHDGCGTLQVEVLVQATAEPPADDTPDEATTDTPPPDEEPEAADEPVVEGDATDDAEVLGEVLEPGRGAQGPRTGPSTDAHVLASAGELPRTGFDTGRLLLYAWSALAMGWVLLRRRVVREEGGSVAREV